MRLWWKFWAATWVAVVAMLGALMLLFTQWHQFESYLDFQRHPHSQLQHMVEVIESGLAAGVDISPLLLNHDLSDIGTLYLIDNSGADYLNRPLPSQLISREPALAHAPADQAVAEDPQSSAAAMSIFARAVYPSQGNPYFMIFAFDQRRHPIWLLFRRFGLMTIVVPSLLISGLVSGWLAWLVVRPINRLALLSQAHSRGEFDAPVDARELERADEIGLLAQQLRYSAQQIKQLMRRQKEFLRDVSHEVRAPLARLRLAAEVAELDDDNSAALERIQREVCVIDDLVQQVLHLSRVDDAQHAPMEALDIEQLIRRSCDDAQVLSSSKRVAVQQQLCPPQSVLRGNEQLLLRMFDNVLLNAVKYSPPSGAISVSSCNTQSGYEISVVDEGPGVPEGDLDKIFLPFVRLSEPSSNGATHDAGFGVGLALVKNVVDVHGGHISASNHLPSGLHIKMELPWASA